jgi:hypothetical protein
MRPGDEDAEDDEDDNDRPEVSCVGIVSSYYVQLMQFNDYNCICFKLINSELPQRDEHVGIIIPCVMVLSQLHPYRVYSRS